MLELRAADGSDERGDGELDLILLRFAWDERRMDVMKNVMINWI